MSVSPAMLLLSCLTIPRPAPIHSSKSHLLQDSATTWGGGLWGPLSLWASAKVATVEIGSVGKLA